MYKTEMSLQHCCIIVLITQPLLDSGVVRKVFKTLSLYSTNYILV
jgi:hypothetical protein